MACNKRRIRLPRRLQWVFGTTTSFRDHALCTLCTVALLPLSALFFSNSAFALDLNPLAFTSFDSSYGGGENKDKAEDDGWRDDDDRERRPPPELGKISIDLKRPESVVMEGVSARGLIATIIGMLMFTTVVGGMLFGRRKLHKLRRKLARPNQRSPRPIRPSSARIDNPKPHQPYTILGIASSASDEEIRARYKHLVKSFHSDKLANHDLPEEILQLTEAQFRKIQRAYEAIRHERNMQ